MTRRRLDAWDGIAVLGVVFLGVFLVAPLGKLLWASVVAEGGGLTLRHYAQFLGRPYSEVDLLNLAFGFESITQHRRLPALTPALGASSR